jgi:hypothetical protein
MQCCILGTVDDNAEMLVLEALRVLSGDKERYITINCDMLLSFGPWCLDRNEDIISTKDFARFVVDLLARQKEVEIEFVFLVLIAEVLLIVDRAKHFMIDGFSNLSGDF